MLIWFDFVFRYWLFAHVCDDLIVSIIGTESEMEGSDWHVAPQCLLQYPMAHYTVNIIVSEATVTFHDEAPISSEVECSSIVGRAHADQQLATLSMPKQKPMWWRRISRSLSIRSHIPFEAGKRNHDGFAASDPRRYRCTPKEGDTQPKDSSQHLSLNRFERLMYVWIFSIRLWRKRVLTSISFARYLKYHSWAIKIPISHAATSVCAKQCRWTVHWVHPNEKKIKGLISFVSFLYSNRS